MILISFIFQIRHICPAILSTCILSFFFFFFCPGSFILHHLFLSLLLLAFFGTRDIIKFFWSNCFWRLKVAAASTGENISRNKSRTLARKQWVCKWKQLGWRRQRVKFPTTATPAFLSATKTSSNFCFLWLAYNGKERHKRK